MASNGIVRQHFDEKFNPLYLKMFCRIYRGNTVLGTGMLKVPLSANGSLRPSMEKQEQYVTLSAR